MNEKTIRMKREDAEKWLAALRSGKYSQGKGALYDGKGYCCLGVLEKVLSGEVENRNLPSMEWLQGHKIEFTRYYGINSDVSNEACDASVFENGEARSSLSEINDMGWNFRTLADIIEKHIQYTDDPLKEKE